ncbi:MAG: stage V sporulation protein AC [Clostridiales bacterium]|nr:stage V sporulation protein AC [Clostridiales bacterium]
MNTSEQTYKKYADARAVKSPILKNCIWAFCSGGFICTIGHLLKMLYMNFGISEDNSAMTASVSLVFIAILLTGIGVFDNIAKHTGAGTLVPITGFANAVASCAIDTKSEGYILGVGAKIFTVAGPVILYGISSGVIYGIIYYFLTRM